MRKPSGFNLFELMITIIIVSILSALAIPLYSTHLVHAKRFEAQLNLIKLAEALEQYYLIHNTYEKATLTQLNFPEKIADNKYQLVITTATVSDFSLNAIPLGKQAKKDASCGTLTLDSFGKKGIMGGGDLADCWN